MHKRCVDNDEEQRTCDYMGQEEDHAPLVLKRSDPTPTTSNISSPHALKNAYSPQFTVADGLLNEGDAGWYLTRKLA